MKVLTLLISMKVKKKVTDVIGKNNAHREINEIMNEWIEQGMVTDVVNENDNAMTRD